MVHGEILTLQLLVLLTGQVEEACSDAPLPDARLEFLQDLSVDAGAAEDRAYCVQGRVVIEPAKRRFEVFLEVLHHPELFVL